jgi:hypothetical protein
VYKRQSDGALRGQIYIMGHLSLPHADSALVLNVDMGGAKVKLSTAVTPRLVLVTGDDLPRAHGVPAPNTAMSDAAGVADELLFPYLTPLIDWTTTVPKPVHEAALVIAIDVLQNRTAAGGQSVGIDGNVGPYRMGRSLLDRVTGLLGPWLDQRSELA